MKRTSLTAIAFALSVAATGALAAHPQDYDNDYRRDNQSNLRNDRARVLRVEEMFARGGSYDYQECWNERTRQNEGGYYRDENGRLYQYGRSSSGSNKDRAIIGAIVGGAIGNQVGDGSGRTAATIAGAVIGANIGKHSRDGNDYNDGYDRYSDSSGVVRRCRMVEDDAYSSRYGDRYGHYSGNASYKVTYEYAGQTYQAVTNSRPGRSLRVLVQVQPQDREVSYRR